MRENRVIVILTFIILMSFTASYLHADMYQYQDETGKMVYTDRLEAIPEKFRTKAQKIDERLEKAGVMTEKKPPREVKEEVLKQIDQISQKSKGFVRADYVTIAIIVAGFLVALIVLFKLREFIGHRKAGVLMFVLLGIVVFIFLYKEYIKKLGETFQLLREETQEIKKEAEKRNEQLKEITEGLFKDESK